MDWIAHLDGPEDAPPLLLVHGFLSSHRHWDLNTQLQQRFRRVRVDLPGHGEAKGGEARGPVGPDLSPERLVAGLDGLRERLGFERWFVCGQSFGAGLTLRYALDHPDRVVAQGFTNANGAFRGPWPAERRDEHGRAMRAIETDGVAGLRTLSFHPAHAKRFPGPIRERLAADADAVDRATILTLMREATPHLSVRDRFARTGVPTLLVNGLWERSFQPVRDWALGALPSLQVVNLEGGHSINIEQPEAFDRAVCDFFLA